MALKDALLPEFDHEMANTRKTLERVPEDRLSWKPHPKSGTMGWLATHVANISFVASASSKRIRPVCDLLRTSLSARYILPFSIHSAFTSSHFESES